MTETIEQRVYSVLHNWHFIRQGDAREILSRASLRVDLEFDDDDMIEVIVQLEDKFEIDIEDEEWDQVQTVGDVVALVTAKVGG